jgi:large subunit ribosomal protein L13
LKLTEQTISVSREDALRDRRWLLIDAADRPLGRVASRAASLLRGKHRPDFTPNQDAGDFVVVINAAKVKLTGSKAIDKLYYRHS